MHAHNITQLFAALDLVFFEPLFEQVLAPLRQDRLGKLQRLVLVQRTTFEEHAKVLQDGRERTRLTRHLLQLLNHLRRA